MEIGRARGGEEKTWSCSWSGGCALKG